MHVRFSDTAEADLDQIHDHISKDNSKGAKRVVDSILQSAVLLGQFPLIGRPGRREGTREFSVANTNYFIVYTIPDEYYVDIETIIHTSRNYPHIQ